MIMAVVILLGSSNHVHHLMIENVNNVFTVALVAPAKGGWTPEEVFPSYLSIFQYVGI